MIIDSKGRLFGKLSLMDLLVVVAVVGLCVGFFIRAMADETVQILNANQVFYTTLMIERVREFSVEAVHEGDIFYEQFGGLLGRVVRVEVAPSDDILRRTDGTAVVAPVEGRYNVFVTLESRGNVNNAGFFVGGNNQLAVGAAMRIRSNKLEANAHVFHLSEVLD